jgi:hypothetical protein
VTAEQAWSTGDRALLERLLAETRVQTSPPGPSGTDYLTTVAEAFAQWLASRIELLGGLLHIPPVLLYGVAWSLLALITIVLALAVVRIVRTRRRRTVARTPAQAGEALPQPATRPEAWAQELERRLKGADPRAALEALWWWLARALKGTEAEASWTTRELLTRAGRADLLAEGRVLDRLLYGAQPPQMTEVRGLAGRLQRALA